MCLLAPLPHFLGHTDWLKCGSLATGWNAMYISITARSFPHLPGYSFVYVCWWGQVIALAKICWVEQLSNVFMSLTHLHLKILEMQMMPCTIWMPPTFMEKTYRLNLPEEIVKVSSIWIVFFLFSNKNFCADFFF